MYVSTAKILVKHLLLIELCGEYTSMHPVGFGGFTWPLVDSGVGSQIGLIFSNRGRKPFQKKTFKDCM